MAKKLTARERNLRSMNKSYKKAVKLMNEMEKQGFRFSASFQKKMSLEGFAKSAGKPTKAKAEALKKLASKTGLYEKATGFVKESGQEVSVQQGRTFLRRQTKSKQTTQKDVSMFDAVRDLIDGIPEFYDLPYSNGKWEHYHTTNDKSRIIQAVDEMENKGENVSRETYEKMSSLIAQLDYARYVDQVVDMFGKLEALLKGGKATDLDGGAVDLIGTPYEE